MRSLGHKNGGNYQPVKRLYSDVNLWVLIRVLIAGAVEELNPPVLIITPSSSVVLHLRKEANSPSLKLNNITF